MFKRRGHGIGEGRRGGRGELWGMKPRGPGHHGERHGRFEHGKLRFVILQLIAEKPSHGYELIKAIEDQTGGAYSPSPGVIYPTLTLLEELDHVEVDTSDANRKLYTITAAGKKFLAENKEILAAIQSRMQTGGGRYAELAPAIVRAMENLKTALRLRLSQGSLTSKQVQAIAGVLDGAATHIESV